MTNKFRKLGYLIPVVFLGGLIIVIDIDRFVRTLARTNPRWYVVSILIFLLSYIPLTIRWRALLESIGHDVTDLNCFEMIAITYGLNKVLPANIGDVSRSAVADQYITVEEHSEILGLVAFERVIDMLTVGVLILGAALLLPTARTAGYTFIGGGVALAIVVILAIGREATVHRTISSLLPPSFDRAVENILFTYNRLSGRTAVAVMGHSLLRWGLLIAVLLPLSAAIGVEISIPVAVLVVGLMSLTTVLPLSPGGIGPVETVGVGTLVLFAFPLEAALTLVFLHRSLGLVLTTLIALVVYSYRASVRPEI